MSKPAYSVSMDEKQSWERFEEGLKKAASRAKQMGKAQQNEIWSDVGALLDELRINGKVLYQMKPLTDTETNIELERAKQNIIVN